MKRILMLMLGLAFAVLACAMTNVGGSFAGLYRPMMENKTITVTTDDDTPNQKVNVKIFDADAENEADEDADTSDRAFFGVVTDDMSLNDARTMNYAFFYGIKVTEVVRNSPAQKYGIRNGDVLMEINDEKIKDTDSFTEILGYMKAGDKVTLKYFREGDVKTIDFVLGSRDRKINTETGEEEAPSKPQLSVGGGGGGWIPMWYTPDLDDVNEILGELGFDSLNTDGLFMNGIGGQGNIGKNWFLGGYGVWYSMDRNTNVTLTHSDGAQVNAIRRLRYSVGFGGVTLDKRFALSRKLVASTGFLLGWGGTRIQCDQFDGKYDWNNLDEDLASSDNNHINISKHYIMVQPRVDLMYRITSWLSMRAEVGYLASYSYRSGWEDMVVDQNYQIDNSPDTSFDGWTFSLGPWFGF